MSGDEKRHLMQNLFGDESEEDEEEEEEEEEEVDSHPHLNRHLDYASDELKPEVEDAGRDGDIHEMNHDNDPDHDHDHDHNHIESEGERDKISQEIEMGEERDESEGNDSQRVVTSRRRDVVESESEENHYVGNADEDVEHTKSPRSPDEEKDEARSQTLPEVREVFGESDDEETAEYDVQNHLVNNSNRSPMEEEHFENHYYSEDDNTIMETKTKDKPVGPPLELGIPLRPPPQHPEKMNMIKVSNIMGIDPKPFDPKTFVEEDPFDTDESGNKKRIRLENNIVRFRIVKNPDGTRRYESNARFIRWSDGSLQLQIGNEVLDTSVQDAQHDQAHLFLRHEKGILQSQGKILKKMRFMPSSLTSNSHRLLTALVDSHHKKEYKVKNCVTAIDPEREKEQKEKAESQTIRANELLSRKKEKVNRKYTHSVHRERQLSPGFLEDALDEDDEADYYEPRRSGMRNRLEQDYEMEARAEKRIINAKRSQAYKDHSHKSSSVSTSKGKSSRRPTEKYESEREESEYETEEEEEEEVEEGMGDEGSEEEAEFKHKGSGSSKKHKEIESEEESPPIKPKSYRRKALVYDSDED